MMSRTLRFAELEAEKKKNIHVKKQYRKGFNQQ